MRRYETATRTEGEPSRRLWKRLAVGIAIPIAAGAMAGCNHVALDTGAEGTRVIDQAEASGCERVGNTHVKVLAKVLGIKRGEDKMSKELATLARNAAIEMNGNAVMAESEISDGGQKFGIYRCPPTDQG